MLNIKQIISLVLFMIITTTVVNAHALSHLFDDDLNSIEVCDTCDEFTISNHDVFVVGESTFIEQSQLTSVFREHTTFNLISAPVLNLNSGQYFNKPPPFKLV
ncbi:hypothetical protein [Psychroflexus tropicus]|uniref:hypothetical protein n=1 Tax=Psychroflexus tropicus TaxID=197345 RepID=UPI00036F8E26|nr:hypothetical protein [Psychroflexus tropicus]